MTPNTPTTFRPLDTRTGYDLWSQIYDDEENPLIVVEETHFGPLLGDIRGMKIADLGCGTGRHAVRLAQAGAEVTALDFSAGMLERAKQRPGAERVRFLTHDVQAPIPLADRSFDRVISCLVIEHVADLPAFFAECARICRRDGAIVVSTLHPAMMLRGITARFTDPATGEETRPHSHPHEISDFVMAALRAGLRIDHMTEHAVDAATAHRCPRAEKYLGWPILLLFRLLPPN